jgi:hypothetical protein
MIAAFVAEDRASGQLVGCASLSMMQVGGPAPGAAVELVARAPCTWHAAAASSRRPQLAKRCLALTRRVLCCSPRLCSHRRCPARRPGAPT